MKGRALLRWALVGTLWTVSGRGGAQEAAETAEPGKAKAGDGRFAVSAKYGSLGAGADLTYGWSRDLHGRVSLNYDPRDDAKEREWIRAAGSLLLDWHPGGGSFRLSGGLAYLRRELDRTFFQGRSSGANELTSYFGVGWGNPLRRGSRWSFLVDLGAFGGGGFSYSTARDKEGAAASIAREDGDTGGLRVHASWQPAISAGVSFRF